ncbi:MAG: 16S rRNA (uracil(1498)-N(3))-methyltransferase [Anaerolineaceae bacterium]|nr:16S rRNA (uracil(1498)-N(3))-methyltransferase [Anaerolineaceae bacterium]
MHRFFIPRDCINGDIVHFPAEEARQIQRVLRLKPGQPVAVVCPTLNENKEYRVELAEITQDRVTGMIRSLEVLHSEPVLQVTLYLALTQREKFEWMLQKCTEAGASGFVPFTSERSLVQEPLAVKKLERWKKILKEAAEQSGRGRIPTLSTTVHFVEAISGAVKVNDLVLAAWEGEKIVGLREVRKKAVSRLERIAVFIGPEGGFASKEMEFARRAGAITFSLGERILRMETAALAAALLILYEFDIKAQSSGGGAVGP